LKHYHHQQFSDLSALLARKQAMGETISLVIPTLNEEATVGDIVATIRRELMDQVGLVDEILVIDSGSQDRTCEIARAAGARVFSAAEIAPEWGNHPGKGENLWKSQFVAQGSIFCFIDGDILDFHSGFVTGLVGPLLDAEHPHTQYVKAFYRRPLLSTDGPVQQGGGRVSEILMRPLFSLFYPQLCEFIQPLAGEYAVRRSLLERLSFPCGYAVETTHLIDTLQLCGMEAFAQCDLDCRHHRNRDLADLGEMSCAILQVFLARAERDGLLALRNVSADYIRQIWVDQEWERQKKNLDVSERPAYATRQHPHLS
jgi:glucosyl-3-phosphoglycerate synthase